MAQRTVTLLVNGSENRLSADEATPLLYVLRNELKLSSPRFGCGVGQCGACHVWVNGVSVPSCDTPLGSVDGQALTTVEGLAPGDALHPVQQAFIDEQAAQCGYCLSGILMTAAAVLAANANPTDAQVRAALDKHLCRCGSHNRIVRAVLRAAAALKAPA
jgi:nicotinate dehydrogenase subunit A